MLQHPKVETAPPAPTFERAGKTNLFAGINRLVETAGRHPGRRNTSPRPDRNSGRSNSSPTPHVAPPNQARPPPMPPALLPRKLGPNPARPKSQRARPWSKWRPHQARQATPRRRRPPPCCAPSRFAGAVHAPRGPRPRQPPPRWHLPRHYRRPQPRRPPIRSRPRHDGSTRPHGRQASPHCRPGPENLLAPAQSGTRAATCQPVRPKMTPLFACADLPSGTHHGVAT